MPALKTMNKRTINIIVFLLLYFLIHSCSYNFPSEPESNEGTGLPEYFSNFYVLGDTYASGFMDGALYKGGQEYSYPGIFGSKLNEIYAEPVFQQAEVASETGFNAEATAEAGSIKGKYSLLYRTVLSIYPARNPSEGDQINSWTGSLTDLHDFSIPGMKSFEADSSGALDANVYFSRLNAGNATPADLVIDRQPGAVLINLGYEDILNYALNGGAGSENPAPADIGEYDLTPGVVFESTMNSLVNRLLNETNSDIFIATIFNPLAAPYFQTLKHVLEIERYSGGYIGSLGNYYEDFNLNVFHYNDLENGGAPDELDRPKILFDSIGYPNVDPRNRARVIVDEYLADAILNDGTVIPKWRQLSEKELVLYKNEPYLNESSPLSGEVPLSDAQALTEPEIEIINQRVQAFNSIIENLASAQNRVHLVDITTPINLIIDDGYIVDGVRPSLEFDRYGIFSADGYTLNPRGNAIIANELIKAVNEVHNSNLQPVDPNLYRGNEILGRFN